MIAGTCKGASFVQVADDAAYCARKVEQLHGESAC